MKERKQFYLRQGSSTQLHGGPGAPGMNEERPEVVDKTYVYV